MCRYTLFAFVFAVYLASASCVARADLRVTDEEGQPVKRFQTMWHTAGQGYSLWESGFEPLTLRGFSKAEVIDLLVRADGYATEVVRFSNEERDRLLEGDARITLRRGREVQLQFVPPSGVRFPEDLRPQLYFPEFAKRVRSIWQPMNLRNGVPDFNMLNANIRNEGVYSFRVSPGTEEFFVAIYHPGWLRYFEAGPFTVEDIKDDLLRIPLPRPTSIQAMLDVDGRCLDLLGFDQVRFELLWHIPRGGNAVCFAAQQDTALAENEFRAVDLAPGEYSLITRTVPKGRDAADPISATGIDPNRFHDRKVIQLKSGESHRVAVRFVPFDAEVFRGQGNAVVKLLTPSGEPAVGHQLKVSYYDGHYGNVSVCEELVPEDGIIHLNDISRTVPEGVPFGPYTVTVDEQRLGFFRLDPDETDNTFNFRLIPQAGDQAPDLEMVQLQSNEVVRLRELRGRIVYLELWATWCGPCQPMMDKLNQMSREHAAAWGDRVVVLPLSVDEDSRLVLPHIERRGWTYLDHYWSVRGRQPHFAQAQENYSIFGIPTALLIDTKGRIVWRGHPREADAHSQIDALLSDVRRSRS